MATQLSNYNSTLFVTPFSNVVKRGPKSPMAVAKHCFVKITDKIAISIGGVVNLGVGFESSTKDLSDRCYYYDISSQQWSIGPVLRNVRAGHGCQVVKDYKMGKALVIVAGNLNYFNKDLTIEILDVASNEWMLGNQSLKTPLYMAKMLSLSQFEILAYGGAPIKIFKIMCFNMECVWTKLPMQPTLQRESSAVMLVPEQLIECEPIKKHQQVIQCHNKSLDFLANGQCEENLDNHECFYDGGDCLTTTTTSEPDRNSLQCQNEVNYFL